jgi:DNA-binding CsgD family transcriptional regulator
VNAVSPLVCPILLGRDDLLELVDRRLAAAHEGRGQLLFFVGEAGIGKTRLLQATERKARRDGFAVAGGALARRDIEVPAAVWLDWARYAPEGHAAAREAGRQLVARLADESNATGGDAGYRHRLLVLDAVDIILSAATDPILISLEDLHWADDLSLEILGTLARRIADRPVLVVATIRSDELYPHVPMREWRRRLLTQRLAEEAHLSRLSADETATMASLLLETGLPASRDTVEAIHDRTNGVPLYVEELVGVLRASAGPDGHAVDDATVPETIEDVVRERLESRSPEARALAEAGAVIGRCFMVDVVAGVMERPLDQLSTPLQELIDHFFLVGTSVRGLYDFRHNLIRDAIYGRIPEPDRRVMHARVAELGEGLPGAADAFASAHFEQAGRTADAFRFALTAAQEAARISSHRQAVQLYRRALRTMPDELPAAEAAEILAAYAAEAAATDDNAAAAETFARARALYLDAGSTLEAAATIPSLVAARHLLGEGFESRVALLRQGLDEVRSLGRMGGAGGAGGDIEVDRVRGRLLAALATACLLVGKDAEVLSYAEEARRVAESAGDGATVVNALASAGVALSSRGNEGWTMLERAVLLARDANLEADAARAYRLAGATASSNFEYVLAERWLRAGVEYAERVDLWNHRHYMAAHLAHVLWATGRWDEAQAVAEHALADGRGGITTRITALFALGYVAFGRGDREPAEAALEEALGYGQRIGELQRIAPPIWGLAELALVSGDAARAVEMTERGENAESAVRDATYLLPFLVTGTRARLAVGDPDGARRWVEALRPRLEADPGSATRTALAHVDGLLYLAGGTPGSARAALADAVRGWDERGRTWEAMWARLDLAQALLRSNRVAQAIPIVDEVRLAADRLPSRPLADRAAGLLRAARSRHPDDERWEPLTVREFEVARHIAAGRTNAEIAEALSIARKTVSAHVEHILAKLGASRRAEIGAWVANVERSEAAPRTR